MTFLAFLNELSFPTGAYNEAESQKAVRGLVATLKALRKVQNTAALHSSVPLGQVTLGENAWLASLAAGPLRDEWRYLRGFDNRAPFRVGLGETFGLDSEYRFDGQLAEGLGLGHALGTLCVSLESHRWNYSVVELERIFLHDDGETESEAVQVHHAASVDHIAIWADWLRRVTLAGVDDGDDLWNRRAELSCTRFRGHQVRLH